MNTKQIQFNRQKVASLLLAGVILAATAGLTWAGADESGSTFQPTQMGQSEFQLSSVKGRKLGVGSEGRTDFLGCESGLSSEFHLMSVKGRKLGAGMDRTDSGGCESGLLPWSQLRAVKAGKMGNAGGGFD
jgi:hypothetical protein